MSAEPYDPPYPKGDGQGPSSSMREAQAGIEATKQILANNITAAQERGARADELRDKANHLSAAAQDFNKRSHGVRKRYDWEHNKWRIYLAIGIIVLLAIIIIPAVVATRK